MGDACYDYSLSITGTGITTLNDAFFRIEVSEVSGESILRIEHNLFEPAPAKDSDPDIVRISKTHFWRIGFLKYNTTQASYQFTYNQNIDKDLMQGYTYENFLLLYRKDASHGWQIIPTTVMGTNSSGRLTANFILPGEYTLGIGDNVKIKERESLIEVYPNPTSGELRVTSDAVQVTNVEVFDVYGRKVFEEKGERRMEKVINFSHFQAGIYFVKIETDQGFITKKIIKL
jgi:hypothetical protein